MIVWASANENPWNLDDDEILKALETVCLNFYPTEVCELVDFGSTQTDAFALVRLSYYI